MEFEFQRKLHSHVYVHIYVFIYINWKEMKREDHRIYLSLFCSYRPSMWNNGSQRNGCNNRGEIDFTNVHTTFSNRIEWINRIRKKELFVCTPDYYRLLHGDVAQFNLDRVHILPKNTNVIYLFRNADRNRYRRTKNFACIWPTNHIIFNLRLLNTRLIIRQPKEKKFCFLMDIRKI